jgi:mRNA interferase RelE/StbE
VGLKRYKIKFLKNVSERDLPILPKTIKSRVEEIIKERLTVLSSLLPTNIKSE